MTNQPHSIMERYLLYAAFLQSKQHFRVKNLASFFFILLFYLVLGKDMAWGQTLGVYPSSAGSMSQNTGITPSTAPGNATKIVANCTQVRVGGSIDVLAGTQSSAVAIGDFNGDGNQDLGVPIPEQLWNGFLFILFIIALQYILQENKVKSGRNRKTL
jgi:hypothetical protein